MIHPHLIHRQGSLKCNPAVSTSRPATGAPARCEQGFIAGIDQHHAAGQDEDDKLGQREPQDVLSKKTVKTGFAET